MEEKRNEREGDGRNHCTDKDVRHTFTDRRLGPVGEIAENREEYERGEIVACHDDAYDPLNVQYLVRIARFQLSRGYMVHPSRENVRQKCRAPRVVHLPQEKDSEERESDQKSALVIQPEDTRLCF